jgi:hypothetical protein
VIDTAAIRIRYDAVSPSRFPSFFEGTGNKRIVDAELLCEKNRGRAIRWEQVHDVQQNIEYRLKD